MAPIKSPEDALMLVRKLAEYYQRRLNRLMGVGRSGVSQTGLYDIIRCKTHRDAASEIARRLHRGIEQGKHPELKRPRKKKGGHK